MKIEGGRGRKEEGKMVKSRRRSRATTRDEEAEEVEVVEKEEDANEKAGTNRWIDGAIIKKQSE